MGTVLWGAEIAAAYDHTVAERFDPAVVEPVVERLVELADGGRALELAIGTGRIALPLRARGVDVAGIELSPHMLEQLRAKPDGRDVPVVVGDMARVRAEGRFRLVYLVFNTLHNLTTQDEQVAVFANAAAHLEPGGVFVLEMGVPPTHDHVFDRTPGHVGIETIDDAVGQISSSHHWWDIDGRLVRHSAAYRYVWPSELDLMARLAGLRLRHRWCDWGGSPFTSDSRQLVVVYELPTGASR